MSASFTPDHSGVAKMLQAQFMEDAMVVVAKGIKDRAETIAPVGHVRDRHPGRYKSSFKIRSHSRGGAPGRYGAHRAEAIVYNDSPEAYWVEFGHRGREPEHILAQAAFRRI